MVSNSKSRSVIAAFLITFESRRNILLIIFSILLTGILVSLIMFIFEFKVVLIVNFEHIVQSFQYRSFLGYLFLESHLTTHPSNIVSN